MTNIPSKELLSAALGVEVVSVREIHLNRTLLYETYKLERINIYELAHKCKEWAFGQDKYKWLFSYKALIGSWCDIVDNHNRSNIIVRFSGDTEPEAIFKACEWILEQTRQEKK